MKKFRWWLGRRLKATYCWIDITYPSRYGDIVELILLSKSGLDQPHVLMPIETARRLRKQLDKVLEQ